MNRRKIKRGILPKKLKKTLRQYFIKLIGLCSLFCMCFILLSLTFHNSADESLFCASTFPTKNMLGVLGAYISDILLQLFGISIYIIVLMLIYQSCHHIYRSKVQTNKIIWSAIAAISFQFLILSANKIYPHVEFLGAIPYIFFEHLYSVYTSKTSLIAIASASLFALLVSISFIFDVQIINMRFFRSRFFSKYFGKFLIRLFSKLFKRNKVRYSIRPIVKLRDKHVGQKQETHESTDFKLPDITLLDEYKKKMHIGISKERLLEASRRLTVILQEFGVHGEIEDIHPGPVVTLYEFAPAPGIKTSRVISLADDIARSMSVLSARIATIPGKNVIGIELPNKMKNTVYFRELIESEAFYDNKNKLPISLGKNISGAPIFVDLTKMPHLLIAGTTGSGKSVSINTIILSLLYRMTPEKCRMIMIDPKMLELSVYDDIPHLLAPVITNPKKAVNALKWIVKEMEQRYMLMSKLGVRNIDGYNDRIMEAKEIGEVITYRVQTGFDQESGKPVFENKPVDYNNLPYIIVVVDEMADLMMVAGKEIENYVQRLAQMARAAGIHLIMATQRPSVDVITGTIKANFPTRISFHVTSKIDSRTILGEQGAEQLLGQGDMLYMATGGNIMRIHGAFVGDKEIERVVTHLKAQRDPDFYIDINVASDIEKELEDSVGAESDEDPLFQQSVDIIMQEGKVSTSFIQRKLKIGYNRAARLVEEMEEKGIVSEPNRSGKRQILAQ